ncbi:MAG: hypothetical protein PHU27_02045 [Salinivirgaceae bacterium]|nr:hypothetical protein [Salinivirgaceae bacterium]MDD4746639.1 hypothetical protein [Salinivirgaceae bacterium]
MVTAQRHKSALLLWIYKYEHSGLCNMRSLEWVIMLKHWPKKAENPVIVRSN